MLSVTILLVLAVYTSADNTFVVLAPKTIRPGSVANLQYNLRDVQDYNNVVTEVLQGNQVKLLSAKPFRSGEYYCVVIG